MRRDDLTMMLKTLYPNRSILVEYNDSITRETVIMNIKLNNGRDYLQVEQNITDLDNETAFQFVKAKLRDGLTNGKVRGL